jgi:hypothetical protein
MNTNPVVLAKFPSASKPGHYHEVRLGADGNLYCLCPSWRFQKNSPTNRSCKHIVAFKASAKGNHFSQGAEPVAIRAPRRTRRVAAPVAPVQVNRFATIPSPPPEGCVDEVYRPTAWEHLDQAGE